MNHIVWILYYRTRMNCRLEIALEFAKKDFGEWDPDSYPRHQNELQNAFSLLTRMKVSKRKK